MFESIIKSLKCSFCGKEGVKFNPQSTFEAYSEPDTFVLDDVDKIVDGVISEWLVYECLSCKSVEKITWQELEKIVRHEISKRVIHLAATGEMMKSGAGRSGGKVFVYCGACRGFDGKGSCLLKIYKECKIKRIPNEL